MTKQHIILPFFLCFCTVFSAQISVSGRVVNEKNQPFIYAKIKVYHWDSLLKGAMSDENGAFELILKKGRYTFSLDYIIGYQTWTKQMTISLDTIFLQIVLKENVKTIKDVEGWGVY